jgi:AP-2 complex subunit alpha
MLNENNDILRLTIQAMKKDLAQGTDEIQCLALATIANVGGEEYAESLAGDVTKLLVSATSRNFVKKKAALALLRLYRKYPDVINHETFPAQIANVFDDHNLGVVLSVSSLLLGVISSNSEPYANIVPLAIKQLGRLLTTDVGKGYVYYKTACPWLQVKLLKLLQYFPPPTEKGMTTKLGEHLAQILTKTEVTKSVNKNNSDYSILFEAVHLIIHLNLQGVEILMNQALALLGRFIAVREPNIRYLGLEAMAKFCKLPSALPTIRRHLSTIQYSLKQSDISIRRRALDLMFSLCDSSNVEEVINHLLSYLAKADFGIKEEMVLKIAILAERYAQNKKWYIDIILKLISIAGDFVSEDILFRVIQIISLDEDLQEYAAAVCFEELKNPQAHETLVLVGGYILGEYGHTIDDKGMG